MADELPPVVAHFEADSDDFDQVVDHVEERLEELEGLNPQPSIGADDSVLEEKVAQAEAMLEELSNSEARPDATLDTSSFEENVSFVEQWMDELADLEADPTVQLKIADLIAQYDLVLAMMQELREQSVRIPVDFAEGEGSLGLLAQSMDKLSFTSADAEGSLGEVVSTLDRMAQATSEADAQVEKLNIDWAALLSRASSATAVNALQNLAQQPELIAQNPNLAAQLARAKNSEAAGNIAALYGLSTAAPEGGGEGGGGGFDLMALLFGPKGPSTTFGIPHAPFASIAGFAGFGGESMLTTVASLGGSLLGAGIGAGALGFGAAGTAAVGMGTDMAGIGQAANDLRQYQTAANQAQTAQQTFNAAVAMFGPFSQQANQALQNLQQAQLNEQVVLQGFPAVAQGAIVALSGTVSQFKTQFDQVTGPAEKTGAEILQQLVQVGEKFLPTIGKFASENMTIIQASLQPLLTWIQGPGLSVFTQLEHTFQNNLPAAMSAFTSGVELIIRVLGFLQPYMGHLTEDLAKWLGELNGADFGRLTGGIAHAIDLFHTWWDLIKAVGDAIYELFTHDAQTGQAIIEQITQMVLKFDDWIKTASGGQQVNQMLEAHKQELLSILSIIPHFIAAWGQLHLVASPVLMEMVSLLAQIFNMLLDVPGLGQLIALAAAFELIGRQLPFGLLNSFHSLLRSVAIDGVQFLGQVLLSLGGPFTRLGEWMTGFGTTAPTAAERAAAGMQAAAEAMQASAAQIEEALTGVGAAADTMAANVTTASTEAQGAMERTAVVAQGSAATTDAALASEGGAGVLGGAGATLGAVGGSAATAGAEIGAAEGTAGGLAGMLGTAATAATGIGLAVAPVLPLIGLAAGAAYLLAQNTNTASAAQNNYYNQWHKMLSEQPETLAGLQKQQAQIEANAQAIIKSEFKGAPPMSMQQMVQAEGGKSSELGVDESKLASVNNQIATANMNIEVLSHASGLATPYVQNLANALGINLYQALNPAQVQQFNAYIAQQGGIAAVMGQQWTQAGQATESALILMVSKTEAAFPGISQAAAEMITATVPQFSQMAIQMTQHGQAGAAGLVGAFLAHLPQATLASKQMHDSMSSPLLPLVEELRNLGYGSAASMVQAWIGQTGSASAAGSQMHDAIKNPLVPLQSELAANGDAAGAALVANILKHNPQALTAGGTLKASVVQQLQFLEGALTTIGDQSGAALVQSLLATNTTPAQSVGTAIAANIAAGVNLGRGQIIASVDAAVSAASSSAAAAAASSAAVNQTIIHTQVPHAAEGGLVTKPTLALVGEAGPELIIPAAQLPHGFENSIAPLPSLPPLAGATSATGGASISIGGLHFYGNPMGIDPNQVGQQVADQVRVAQLRAARAYGKTRGVLGNYAGSRSS